MADVWHENHALPSRCWAQANVVPRRDRSNEAIQQPSAESFSSLLHEFYIIKHMKFRLIFSLLVLGGSSIVIKSK
jgi:hypothetical protein